MRPLAALLALGVAGCSPSLEDQQAALDRFNRGNQFGDAPDQYLVKRNAFGDWERTALIYGYLDDEAFCLEVAELYEARYPADRYTCIPAN